MKHATGDNRLDAQPINAKDGFFYYIG